jgi:hypothetical protein
MDSTGSTSGEVIYRFRLPAPVARPAEVTAIYPSASVVPENLLRFYIHFSAPMSRGDVYQHIGLLDGRDRPVELPFLELGEELWDPAQQRLTLLIDPGRIKRGVKPREEVGTALREGEQFTLVVQATWLDAQNRPLAKAFVKKFRVGPPLQRAIDPAEWQIGAPAQGTREPLTIDFPGPLDQALLGRMISVRHCDRRTSGRPADSTWSSMRHWKTWQAIASGAHSKSTRRRPLRSRSQTTTSVCRSRCGNALSVRLAANLHQAAGGA